MVATVGLAVVRLKVVRVEDAVAARVRADEAMGVPLLAQRKDGLKIENKVKNDNQVILKMFQVPSP